MNQLRLQNCFANWIRTDIVAQQMTSVRTRWFVVKTCFAFNNFREVVSLKYHFLKTAVCEELVSCFLYAENKDICTNSGCTDPKNKTCTNKNCVNGECGNNSIC